MQMEATPYIVAPAFDDEGLRGDEVRRKAADKLLDSFGSYLVDELGRSPRTAVSYRAAINRASTVIGKPAHKVTADDLRDLLRTTDYAQATKRGIIVAFHQFHDYGVVEGAWKRNGIASLKTPKVARNIKPPLDTVSAHTLLANSVTGVTARITYLGLFAGLRIREATLLREEHWQGDAIVVPAEIAKGGKKRKIPVHPELQEAKELVLSRTPTDTTMQVMFGRLRERFGVTDMEGGRATPHTLRRTFGSEMYRRGVPWEVVAKLLGHGGDVTALYARIGWDKMTEAVALLSYTDGKPVQLSFEL